MNQAKPQHDYVEFLEYAHITPLSFCFGPRYGLQFKAIRLWFKYKDFQHTKFYYRDVSGKFPKASVTTNLLSFQNTYRHQQLPNMSLAMFGSMKQQPNHC